MKITINQANMNVLYVKNKHSLYELLMSVLVAVLTGGLAALLIKNYRHPDLFKNELFLSIYGSFWLVILVLMGLSSYRAKLAKAESVAHVYYALQILTVFLWHITFFRFENAKVAFCIIAVYIFLIISTFFEFEKIDKIAGYLMIPAVLWTLLATGYNFMLIK